MSIANKISIISLLLASCLLYSCEDDDSQNAGDVKLTYSYDIPTYDQIASTDTTLIYVNIDDTIFVDVETPSEYEWIRSGAYEQEEIESHRYLFHFTEVCTNRITLLASNHRYVLKVVTKPHTQGFLMGESTVEVNTSDPLVSAAISETIEKEYLPQAHTQLSLDYSTKTQGTLNVQIGLREEYQGSFSCEGQHYSFSYGNQQLNMLLVTDSKIFSTSSRWYFTQQLTDKFQSLYPETQISQVSISTGISDYFNLTL